MFVSYLAQRSLSPAHRRAGVHTNRQYYQLFAVDGRAVLQWAGGTRWNEDREPLTWLADVDGQLWVCSRNATPARPVKDGGYVPASAVYDHRPDRVH
jgi:hypothetical protein